MRLLDSSILCKYVARMRYLVCIFSRSAYGPVALPLQKRPPPHSWVIISPLCRQMWGHIASPLSVQSVWVCAVSLSPIHFLLALSILQTVKHETLTQCWADVGPPSTMLSQNEPSIGLPCCVWRHAECRPASQILHGPTLTQLWFEASCPYCQHAGIGRMRYWIGLNGYWPPPATLAQLLTNIGSLSACNRRQQYYAIPGQLLFPENTRPAAIPMQKTQNMCTTSAQRLRRWSNIVQMWYKCFVFTGLNAAQETWGVEPVLVWWWASVADGCWQSVDKYFAPKRNNKFRLIRSLYCPQEPFNNINYKSHCHYIY